MPVDSDVFRRLSERVFLRFEPESASRRNLSQVLLARKCNTPHCLSSRSRLHHIRSRMPHTREENSPVEPEYKHSSLKQKRCTRRTMILLRGYRQMYAHTYSYCEVLQYLGKNALGGSRTDDHHRRQGRSCIRCRVSRRLHHRRFIAMHSVRSRTGSHGGATFYQLHNSKAHTTSTVGLTHRCTSGLGSLAILSGCTPITAFGKKWQEQLPGACLAVLVR